MKKLSLILAVGVIFALIEGCKYDPGAAPGSITVVRPAAKDTLIGGTKNYQITWAGSNIATIKTIEASYDNGATWSPIAIFNSDAYLYTWNVVDTSAAQAMIRITDKNGVVGKSGVFTILQSGPGRTVSPKAGSTFAFKNFQTDTLGKPIDSTITYTRDSVIETGITYAGKTNVTHFISVDAATGAVVTGSDTYYNYESNGDISINTGGAGISGFFGITLPAWSTYPVQSHTPSGFKFLDTTISVTGFPVPIPVKGFDSISYVNNGTYSAGSANIPVFNSRHNTTIVLSIIISQFTIPVTTHLSFAPSLGYDASEITDPTSGQGGLFPSSGGSEKILISYNLK
jgi:hypothetical protein